MNIKEIADILGFDIEDVQMVVEVFKEEAHIQMNLLHSAIKAHDFTSIVSASHAIKGSASNLHLDIISKSAREIEMAARDEKLIDYQTKYDIISIELDTLKV